MIAYVLYGVDKNFKVLAVMAITSKRKDSPTQRTKKGRARENGYNRSDLMRTKSCVPCAALAERSKGCQ